MTFLVSNLVAVRRHATVQTFIAEIACELAPSQGPAKKNIREIRILLSEMTLDAD